MESYIEQLCRHSAWADDRYWNAVEAHPTALADRNICERLFHIHLAQHAFLWAIGPRTSAFADKKLSDFSSIGELKLYGRDHHRQLLAMLTTLFAREHELVVGVSWLDATVAQAVIQSTMHSHYHRGQNAMRLRQFGGVPPNTDFLQWLRTGKPTPTWAREHHSPTQLSKNFVRKT